MVEMPLPARAGRLLSSARWQTGTLRASCVAGAYPWYSLLVGLLTSSCRHATGGSIPGMLPQLPPAQLNLTGSINNTGNVRRPIVVSPLDLTCFTPRCTKSFPTSTSIRRGTAVNTLFRRVSAGRTVSCSGLRPTMGNCLLPRSVRRSLLL